MKVHTLETAFESFVKAQSSYSAFTAVPTSPYSGEIHHSAYFAEVLNRFAIHFSFPDFDPKSADYLDLQSLPLLGHQVAYQNPGSAIFLSAKSLASLFEDKLYDRVITNEMWVKIGEGLDGEAR